MNANGGSKNTPRSLPLVLQRHRWLWPALALVALVGIATAQLRFQGRRWWCECGQLDLWWTNTNSSHNSQHLLDPYSFTHVLHGILICGVLAWALPQVPLIWRSVLAVSIELLWEVIENTSFVIQRYRESTMALGYEGDSIFNSVGDTASFLFGFALARRIGVRGSIAVFLVTELVLLIWIKDNLLLNVIMLFFPNEAIKSWQLGQ